MAPEQVEANANEKAAKEAEAKAENAKREGVGTRLRVGQTRGRNPNVIMWEAFDDSQPKTLPTSIEQFMEVTKVKAENELVDFLIVGFNDAQYSLASDEIGEYINAEWDKETQAQFRLVVRNYAKATEQTIEQAVTLLKPGIDAAFAAKQAAKQAEPATV